MSNTNDYRKEIIDTLLPYFKKDERLRLLVCDMGFGVTDKLKEVMPESMMNCGIMEQGTVGVAAGMALSGLRPVVYSIVNFLVYRALEQIRNDLVLQKLNVKLIGTGCDDYFSFLGPSHCCGKDDIALMKLIDVKVYDPYTDKRPFSKLVDDWINSDGPAYIRV
ncbi:MAG: transketolase [Candidatus Omnitrophica bacterium]|nr:transketolase [Candidatus Omnitrophota bacterium]